MIVTVDDQEPGVLSRYEAADYSAKELALFSGDYYCSELDVTYSIILDEDVLILYINGQKKSALSPIMQGVFANNSYGIFKFNFRIDQSARSFRLAAGRVKNLNFRKE